MKITKTEKVKMSWDSFTFPITVGTPVSNGGVLADSASAYGLIVRTIFAKPDADETAEIMTGGVIDMEEVSAGYGEELSSEAVQALCGIHFYKNGVCIPTGGGGVTPEIMAQIDNAQWKTESSEELFSETVTTAEAGGIPAADGTLSYEGVVTADTLKVTFNGVEYTCTGTGSPYKEYGAPFNTETRAYDFSKYPFNIYFGGGAGGNTILTQTAGTYTISASAETVTTTDTFKKAAQSLSGAVEVSSIDDADVVVVEVSERVNLISTAICTIKTDGTVTLVTNNTEVTDSLAPGLHLFYRCESSDNGLSFIGSNGYLVPNDRGSGVVIHRDIYIGSPTTSTMEILNGPIVRLADNGNIKYYKIGLPHNNDDSGNQ